MHVPVTEVRALASGPLVLGVAFEKAHRGIRIVMTTRFNNTCLAEAGAGVRYADLVGQGMPKTRILLMEQRVAPEGCPDIFQPVSRDLAVDLDEGDAIERIAFLDGPDARVPRQWRVAPTQATHRAVMVLDSTPLFPEAVLPSLEQTGATTFVVAARPGCESSHLRIEAREGRVAFEGKAIQPPVPLWLLIGYEQGECVGRGADSTKMPIEISLQGLALSGRAVRIANPVALQPGAKHAPFRKLARPP